jgi:hypothetical protein
MWERVPTGRERARHQGSDKEVDSRVVPLPRHLASTILCLFVVVLLKILGWYLCPGTLHGTGRERARHQGSDIKKRRMSMRLYRYFPAFNRQSNQNLYFLIDLNY